MILSALHMKQSPRLQGSVKVLCPHPASTLEADLIDMAQNKSEWQIQSLMRSSKHGSLCFGQVQDTRHLGQAPLGRLTKQWGFYHYSITRPYVRRMWPRLLVAFSFRPFELHICAWNKEA
ncbi:hypothetical protein MN608_02842 [Microdochium nivale]|nr:hypothetical protein MN608_02842 [Microdochium nivale]